MDEHNLLTLEQTKDFENSVVKKHFNETDTKLLKLILSQIKGDEEDYLFDFKQLEALGFDIENSDKILFNSLKKIASFYVNVQNGYGDSYQMGLIHNKFIIDKETKILSLKIHKELVPFFNSLKEQYIFKQLPSQNKKDELE